MTETTEPTTGTTDTATLLGIWDAFGSRMTWEEVIARGGNREVAERVLADLPEVTALDALEANHQLVELLIGRRWYVMEAARSAGASWSDIGTALGMSKQGAQDWYRRKLADRERYVPDLHDADTAHAALDEELKT